ncbi:MAG: sensor histidine kinase [Bacillota bacterium]|jgi:two-component system sensor histidine kinase DegS|nr:sensor histidine kinase [Bacillota bacterium]
MQRDESSINSDIKGPKQLQQLDRVFAQVIEALEKSRENIFEINQDCENHCLRLETEIQGINKQIQQVIETVDKLQILERQARIRLMEVSRRFDTMTETDIKKAYENAQAMQIKLQEAQQEEQYLQLRRQELENQIRQYRRINKKADSLLHNASLALKLMQGSSDKLSDTIEKVNRKNQLELWIVEMQEAERRKIARELHDGPAQSLASMLIRLDLVMHMLPEKDHEIRHEIQNIKAIGSESITDVRSIMYDLKPYLMHEQGLHATLKDYFNEYEAKYSFFIDYVTFGQQRQYDLALEVGLLRMVQEAITNVRKHAGVNKALVKFEDNGSHLTLVIKDEGKGFDFGEIRQKRESYGIVGMQERVKIFGGELEIFSRPGEGAQIIIKVPLEGEADHGQSKGDHSR